MTNSQNDEVFVDTSAFYAVLDTDDEAHAQASTEWHGLIDGRRPLVTSSYVCVETSALVQARLGMDAVRILFHDVLLMVISADQT